MEDLLAANPSALDLLKSLIEKAAAGTLNKTLEQSKMTARDIEALLVDVQSSSAKLAENSQMTEISQMTESSQMTKSSQMTEMADNSKIVAAVEDNHHRGTYQLFSNQLVRFNWNELNTVSEKEAAGTKKSAGVGTEDSLDYWSSEKKKMEQKASYLTFHQDAQLKKNLTSKSTSPPPQTISTQVAFISLT